MTEFRHLATDEEHSLFLCDDSLVYQNTNTNTLAFVPEMELTTALAVLNRDDCHPFALGFQRAPHTRSGLWLSPDNDLCHCSHDDVWTLVK